MTDEEADYIVNELTKNPDNFAHGITFFGGEPALRLDLIEKLLEKYKNRGTKFFIITSFTVNQEKILELAEKYTNFEVTVSYDSPDNKQRVYHSGKPVDLRTSDFARMKHAGFNLLKVISGREKDIIKDVNDYLDLLIAYDIYGDVSEVKTPYEDLDYGKLEEGFYVFAKRVAREYLAGRLKFLPEHFAMFFGRVLERDANNMGGCGLLQDIFISSDGTMSPCSIANMEPELHLVDDESYDTAIQAGLQYMAGPCAECKIRYFCPGGCLVDRKRTTGEFKNPNPAWCRYAQAMERAYVRVVNELGYEDLLVLIDQVYKWRTLLYEPCINKAKRITEIR